MKNIRRISIWGILVLAFVLVFFHRISMGAVSDYVSKDFGIDELQLGKLTAMTFYGYALMQIPVGILVDSIGVKKICSIGMFITAAGSLFFAGTNSIGIAYLGRFMVGLGTSVIIVSIMKVQADYFSDDVYSTLSGITSCVGNIGALMATYPLAYMAVNLGWRGTFLILGGITFVISAVIFFIVPEQNKNNKENRVGNKYRLTTSLKSVIYNKDTWINFFIMMLFVGSMTSVLSLWGGKYLSEIYKISIKDASYYTLFIVFGFIVGAPIVGKISDKLKGKVKPILIPCTAGYFAIWFYILVIEKGNPDLGVVPVLFFLMGLFLIGHILAFSNVKRVNRKECLGVATATVNMGEFIGSGLISMLIGYIIKLGSENSSLNSIQVYKTAFYIILAASFMSFILSFMLNDNRVEE